MRFRRSQWFVVLGMVVIVLVAVGFMLFLPLRITSGGSEHDCGTPLSVLTDSGSGRATPIERKCEHHATLRLRNVGVVAAVTVVGGLAIILLWPEDGDDEGTERPRRRPLLTRRFP